MVASDAEETEAAFDRVRQRTRGHEACFYCGNLNWFGLDAGFRQTRILSGIGSVGDIPVYSFACTNCGFVRQHVRDVVDGKVTGEVVFDVPEP